MYDRQGDIIQKHLWLEIYIKYSINFFIFFYFSIFYNKIYNLLLVKTIIKRDELICGLRKVGLKKPSRKGIFIHKMSKLKTTFTKFASVFRKKFNWISIFLFKINVKLTRKIDEKLFSEVKSWFEKSNVKYNLIDMNWT